MKFNIVFYMYQFFMFMVFMCLHRDVVLCPIQ